MTDQPYPPLRPQPGVRRRQQATPWALVIGIVVLAVLATALAVALLTRGTDDPTATTSGTPSPSAGSSLESTPTASDSDAASPEPEPTTSATPHQAAALGLPPGLLPPGAVVSVSADGVRMRSEPTTSAEIITTMGSGDLAYVVDAIFAGPVVADGYEWYRMAYAGGRDVWPWQDLAPDGYVTGWVAAGNEGERFVELNVVSCPTGDVTLELLAFELTGWERLVCLRGSPITIEGTYGCGSCLDVTPGASPAWLADSEQHPPIAGAFEYYPFVQIALPPGVTAPENRTILRATLHVDDRAARTCMYAPEASGPTPALTYDPVAVQTFCRERLVLDSFEVLGTEPAPGG